MKLFKNSRVSVRVHSDTDMAAFYSHGPAKMPNTPINGIQYGVYNTPQELFAVHVPQQTHFFQQIERSPPAQQLLVGGSSPYKYYNPEPVAVY